jgi:tRNA(Ile)-lysidine synthase
VRLASRSNRVFDRPTGGAEPVAAGEFAAAMAALAPFESQPRLAAAVSGGRDSLALALLAERWTRERGGALIALIVDHRLRPESTDEANDVASLLRERGIASEVLRWNAAKPHSGVSEAARIARYGLLERRCRELGILHLLLGHQVDDQAETTLLRLADGSGPEGLAAMSPVVEKADLRLLRPLLVFQRPRLAATVLAHALAWVDDPSNERAEYARVALRRTLDVEKRAALADVTGHAGALRRTIDLRLAALLVDLVTVDPRGFAWLDGAGFDALAQPLAMRLLSRLTSVFGGRHYPARRAGLERAAAMVRAGRSVVAGGCRFDRRGRRVLVCREAGAIGESTDVRLGQSMHWDRRYVLTAPLDARLGGLGSAGRSVALRAGMVELRAFPAPVAEALPALWRGNELAAVFVPEPEQKSDGGGGDRRGDGLPATLIACPKVVFRPLQGLAPPAWPLVLPPAELMYLDRQAFSLRGRS